MIGHAQIPTNPASACEISDQVERILRSGEFAGSELLRSLLSFLAKRAVEKPGESAKEYEIAVEALGKNRDFDPRLDSAVRVHTGRLRSKLAEYYMSDGAADHVVVEVPKGSYQLSCHYRNGHQQAAEGEQTQEVAPARAEARGGPWKWFLAGFGAALLLSCLAAFLWLPARPSTAPAGIAAFWRPFLEASEAPLVVFSNHRFTGTSATGLHRFRDGIDDASDINDTYSGTGTVMAAYQLTRLFSLSGRSVILKRAELLTWDEAKDRNVIFIGSPEANAPLRELPPLQEFAFKSSNSEPRFGVGGVVNVHPRAGEEAIYFGSGKPYTSDYAVLALLPGLKPERRVLILAGTNTYGVQAAAEFVSREDQLADLLSRLGARGRKRVPDFEALLQVKVSGGVPVQARLFLLRPRSKPAAPAN